MLYTPPHSPDPQGLIINQHPHFPPTPPNHLVQSTSTQMEDFAKRPISPPLSSGENSDSQLKDSHPVSLLSALMHPHPRTTSGPMTSGSGSGLLSPHSSVPSTAVSSPHLRPVSAAHSHTAGGLDVPAMSILRRDSVSSDGEALHGLAQGQVQAQADPRPDIVKRASSLKFAVAPPLKRRSPSVNPNTHTPDVAAVPKFDTPPSRDSGDMSAEIEEAVIEEDAEIDDEEEREEEIEDGSEESDLGYQEDSESSDEDQGSPRYRNVVPKDKSKYPFARSTNFRRRRPPSDAERALSPSPPPAPAVLPPPTRRGRGHIRVDESCISGKETEGHCSRHRSPPPSRSRSHSRTRMMGEGRLSDAGPREGRAGSPMPSRSKILAASDEDDDEDAEAQSQSFIDQDKGKKKGDVFGSWGWKSDDAAFKGGMVKGIRTVSAPGHGFGQSAITDDDDLTAPNQDNGVRSFFRRASEHIPISAIPFRNQSSSFAYPQPQPQGSPTKITTGRALSPSGSPCPPALDETPVLASSIARVESDYSGGLAHRLEQSLSTDQAVRG